MHQCTMYHYSLCRVTASFKIFVSNVHEFENFELSATRLSHLIHNYILKEMFFGHLCIQSLKNALVVSNGPCFSEIFFCKIVPLKGTILQKNYRKITNSAYPDQTASSSGSLLFAFVTSIL